MPGGWFTPSAWALERGLADLEAKVAASRNFGSLSAEQQQLLRLNATDYSIMRAAPGGNVQAAWDSFVAGAQDTEAGDEGALGGMGQIIGGAVGAFYGNPQAGAFIGGALDQPTRGTRMDFKDLLRVAASGMTTGEDGIVWDYGAMGSAALDVLRPQPVMAMAPAIGGAASRIPSMSQLMARLGGGAIARAGGAAVGALRSVGGRIVGFFTASGKRVSVKEAVMLAGNIGLSAAAAALAVDEAELAEAVMQELKKRGRGRARGISAAQLRTTRRTMRKIESMHRQIHRAAKSAVSHRR